MFKKCLFLFALASTVLSSCASNVNDDKNPNENNDDENSLTIKEDFSNITIKDDNYRNYYEIFVYSYADSNGDGIGDLKGISDKLDYIENLGYTGIWLTPIFKSPTYHKYNASDYFTIDPQFGTIGDLETLVNKAHARNIKVILDLAINHSSKSNELFSKACNAYGKYLRGESLTSEENKYKDFYSFKRSRDEISKGRYNQVSNGGSTFFYECNFDDDMPEFNCDSPYVLDYFKSIVEYYLDLGVDGFRLDAIKYYYLDDTNKNIEFLNKINSYVKNKNPKAYIVGECFDNAGIISRYAESDIDSLFYFPASQGNGFINTAFNLQGAMYTDYLSGVYELIEDSKDKIPAPFLDNHDVSRLNYSTDIVWNKFLYGLLSMLNGTTFTYYGDEIGMVGYVPPDQNVRIPMNRGEDSSYMCNVVSGATSSAYYYPDAYTQLDDPTSLINYYKKANNIRNKHLEIARGEVSTLVNDETNYFILLNKKYNGEDLGIAINFNQSSSYTLNFEEYGYSTCENYLTSNNEVISYLDKDKNSIEVPTLGIAILR